VVASFELDLDMMRKVKEVDSETKPYFKQDQKISFVK
jgi:hypothetical protein